MVVQRIRNELLGLQLFIDITIPTREVWFQSPPPMSDSVSFTFAFHLRRYTKERFTRQLSTACVSMSVFVSVSVSVSVPVPVPVPVPVCLCLCLCECE